MTTATDRVKSFSLKASGGAYAKLFDGTERVLSCDNIPWIIRSDAHVARASNSRPDPI